MKEELLGEICEFSYGEGLREDHRIHGKVPVYGSNGVVGWHNQAVTNGPTIVIGRKGSIGEVHFSPIPCWPIDTTYYIERPKKECDLRWLYRALVALDLTQLNKAAAVPGLNREDAYRKPILFPDVPEQKRIAALLEKADRLRRTRRYARQLSDTFLQSVFLEMFGDAATNSGNFNKATFDDVVDSTQLGLVRGSGEMNDSFPFAYVRMDSIIGNGTLELIAVKHVKASPAEATQFALKDGDFLFNTRNSRELVGKTALFIGGGTYLFNNNILRVRFKTSADPRYMIQLFQTNWMKQNLERVKSGTTNVFAIYYKDLRDVPVLLPSLPLQQKFAAIVRRFERLRTQQREAERQAEHLFQTLLHRAFTSGL